MYCLTALNKDFTFPIAKAIYEVKQSKFIAYLYVFSETINHTAETKDCIISNLRTEHKKANHFVFASRIINANTQIVESSSDDKEPKGSAGTPMLVVLRGEEIIDVLCICVRYFGGIKLGVGGLVRAYTQACLDVIAKARNESLLELYVPKQTITITNSITQCDYIGYLIRINNLEILHKEFLGDTFEFTLHGKAPDIDKLLATIKAR
ncbi:YigZ family protein [Helicobacter muridarum]|uniref:X-Pro dipeptidase n=1 Tax=Helicobacter muridarum TaxID=216 RepID=A0A377PX84_9HELI|nr:YigZ family protein [Helicobacter muridarum]TLE01308.1 YigZ family protein [Helicobacter muridarum]STQ87177.1 X-Pro dipeptidase [Helicobacter muridarum]